MTTPTVIPASGPVYKINAPRVEGQMYYIVDDLFVVVTAVAYGFAAVVHPFRGTINVPCATLREVRYV